MLTDPEDDYTQGYVPFLDTTIYLDSRPLIPRTETEYWVEQAIKKIHTATLHSRRVRILDLCAGSGCIGVAVLTHIPTSHVTFGEIEVRHLPTIKKNILKNGIREERATIIETDVWSALNGTYDFILANPPYIAFERESVDKTVTAHEPHEALFAEHDGFYFIEKIIKGLPTHLAPTGVCYIEHEPFHTPRIITIANQHGLQTHSEHDQYGVLRYNIITKH